jgi:hypothetical protein
MISSEVQRTLVKSPPELWAELSDPSALARHLGELGDIRITHLEPETAVEWEAEDASGTVLLKPSGWGTKVTLTVNREQPDPAAEVPEPESPVAHEPPAQPISTAQAEPKPLAQTDLQPNPGMEPGPAPQPEPLSMLEAEPLPSWEPAPAPIAEAEHGDQPEEVPLVAAADREPAPEPESRRGFFARLFRRGATEQAPDPVTRGLPATIRSPEELSELTASVEYLCEPPWAVATPQSLPEPLDSLEQQLEAHEHAPAVEAIENDGPVAHAEPVANEPTEETDGADEQPADISAELRAAEEATAEQVTAMLTGVLDRLGAAHHRPFSRS